MEFWQVVRDCCGNERTVASFTKESYADFYMLKYPSINYFKRKVVILGDVVGVEIMDDMIEKEMNKKVERGFYYSYYIGIHGTEIEERKKSNDKFLCIEQSINDFELDSFIDEDRASLEYYEDCDYTSGDVVLYSKTKLSFIEIKQRIAKLLREALQLDDSWIFLVTYF